MNWLQRLALTTVAVALLATVPVVGSGPSCPSACCNPNAAANGGDSCCSKPAPKAEHSCCAPKAEAGGDTSCCPSDSETKGSESKCGCVVAGHELPVAVPSVALPVPSAEWVIDFPLIPRQPVAMTVRGVERILDAGDSSPPTTPLPPDAPRAPPTL